jgi:hypothetical protein
MFNRQTYIMSNQVIVIKPYSTKELSNMYGVSDRIFRKWLKPFEEAIGKKTGHFYTTMQIEIIFGKLGYPNKTIEIS